MIKSIDISRSSNFEHKNSDVTVNTLSFDDIIISFVYIVFIVLSSFFLKDEYRQTYYFYFCFITTAMVFAKFAFLTKSKVTFFFLYSISFFCALFLLAFRNYSALDDHSYVRIFGEVAKYGWWNRFLSTTMEPGYLLLNQIVSIFTTDYFIMQLVSSFIALFLFYYVFYKIKSKISVPLAIFLLFTIIYFQVLSVGIIRMFIAMGFAFNGYYNLSLNKTKLFIICILIASMFHYSALFMLVLLFLRLKKDNKPVSAKKFILANLIVVPIIFYIISYFVVPRLGLRYQYYGQIGNFSIAIMNLDIVPVLLIVLYFRKLVQKENLDIFMTYVAVFSLSAILSLYNEMASLGRLVFYANTGFFILAPMIKSSSKYTFKGIMFSVIVLGYGFVYLLWTQFLVISHVQTLVPYNCIL